MESDKDEVTYGQFHAFGKLTSIDLGQQDISGIDHGKAIHFLLTAYAAFTDGDPDLENEQHRHVGACIDTFLHALPKNEFDYKSLNGLAQDQILMLATAGFDILNLPKMEPPVLGRHFSSELGI